MTGSATIVVTLRSGEARSHIPAQADCLLGACRPVDHIDHGSLDRLLRSRADGFHVSTVFHARRNLGLVGQQASRWDDVEEELGLSRAYRVTLADGTAATAVARALREHPAVETAATVPFVRTSEAASTTRRHVSEAQLWGPLRLVRGDAAAALEPGDPLTVVAVVDTGVALGHPEFQQRLLAGYDCVDLAPGATDDDMVLVGDSRQRDFAPMDAVGHGSHVAGVICARGWRVPPGVAGWSLVLPIRVLAAACTRQSHGARSGLGTVTDIDAGLKFAIDLGADVINLSLGTPESELAAGEPEPHRDIARYARARSCILVAAAGNSGRREKFYPAALPEVIAVASIDTHGQRSTFSSTGDHIAIAAPGEGIVGVGRRHYRISSGTSHAAPFVSGACALLVSRARRLGVPMDSQRARDLLQSSARALPGTKPSEVGAGLLDIRAALERLVPSGSGPNLGGRP